MTIEVLYVDPVSVILQALVSILFSFFHYSHWQKGIVCVFSGPHRKSTTTIRVEIALVEASDSDTRTYCNTVTLQHTATHCNTLQHRVQS